MPQCTTCGSHLTKDYLRVFGDNEDGVDSCVHCTASQRAQGRRSIDDADDGSSRGEAAASEKLVIPLDLDGDRPGSATADGGADELDATARAPADVDPDRSTGPAGGAGGSTARPHSVLSAVLGVLR